MMIMMMCVSITTNGTISIITIRRTIIVTIHCTSNTIGIVEERSPTTLWLHPDSRILVFIFKKKLVEPKELTNKLHISLTDCCSSEVQQRWYRDRYIQIVCRMFDPGWLLRRDWNLNFYFIFFFLFKFWGELMSEGSFFYLYYYCCGRFCGGGRVSSLLALATQQWNGMPLVVFIPFGILGLLPAFPFPTTLNYYYPYHHQHSGFNFQFCIFYIQSVNELLVRWKVFSPHEKKKLFPGFSAQQRGNIIIKLKAYTICILYILSSVRWEEGFFVGFINSGELRSNIWICVYPP